MHETLKEWSLKKCKAFELQKMKLKWNVANFKCKWNVTKFQNANVNLRRIWNGIAFEIHWNLHREKVFDSNEKGFALEKRSQGHGGWVSQKELTSCIFLSNFLNYSLSQMPYDWKLIASKF